MREISNIHSRVLGLALGGAAPEKRCHYRGGGPTGLGAAIMLAKRGWTDITNI